MQSHAFEREGPLEVSPLARKLPVKIDPDSLSRVRGAARGAARLTVWGALAWGLALAALAMSVPLAEAAPRTVPSSASLAAKKAKVAKLKSEVETLTERLSAELAECAKVSAELGQTRHELARTSLRLGVVDRQLTRNQRELNALVVHSYKQGELEALDALLGATTFVDFLSRARLVEILGSHEAATVARLKAAREESRRLRAVLRVREARLASLRNRADARRAAIEADIARQERTLDSAGLQVSRLMEEQERASRAAGVGVSIPSAAGSSCWMSAGSLVPGAYGTVEGRPGRYLVPAGVPRTYRSTGVVMQMGATSYGNADNGPGTSSGRPFNDAELTCAHKTLPFGTLVAVTHGSKRVIVVVTDRGPFTPGRDIDLSRGAARALGLPGVGTVSGEIVVPAS